MIRYQFSVPANNTNSVLECLHQKIKIIDISNFRIVKKSIDARDKKDVKIIYLVEFSSKNEEYLLKHGATTINQKLPQSIEEYLNGFKSKNTVDCVVVGSGPAGLFCALTLIKLGHRVIILERGKSVDERKADIDHFNSSLQLNEESNVLFGEGGAGTFSDGKLNTNLHNEFIQVVLGEFHKYGANESILYDAKPHVGTDVLIKVLKNIRKDIEQLGGKYCFNTRLESVETLSDSLIKIKTNKGNIETKNLFLAIGHSARDTFEMLYNKGIKMESKIFSAGVRIEHLKQDIDFAQYGEFSKFLPSSSYKLSVDTCINRKLYTFCMCPGGYVINASSEEKALNVNGMSYLDRNNVNSNSALLVNVEKEDLKSDHPLAGITFQRKYENLAYEISNSYLAPVQRFSDFKNNISSTDSKYIKPSIVSGYAYSNLHTCLPEYISKALIDGIEKMGKKIKGFDSGDAILTGVEMRSSSPVRILRDEKYNSSIKGIYPIGEGAGYAGGIVSSAIDGIRCACIFSDYIKQ